MRPRGLLGPLLWWAALCICVAPSLAFWQSRDSNYNINVGVATSPVTVVDTGSSDVLCASSPCDFTNLTVTAALPNSALAIPVVQAASGSLTAMAVAWDQTGTPQSATQVCNTTASNRQAWVFGLLAPTAGNKTLRVTWTGAGDIHVDAISLKNVIQTNVGTAFVNPATGNNTSQTTATTTVTSQVNDLVVSSWGTTASVNGDSFSGTRIFSANTGSVNAGAASYDPGAASVTATHTTTSGGNWIGCSIDVVHS